MSGRTTGSPRHPSSRHPRSSDSWKCPEKEMHCKKSELMGGGCNSKKRAFCMCIFPRVRGDSDSYFRCWSCSYFTAFTPTPDFASPLVTVTDTETFDLSLTDLQYKGIFNGDFKIGANIFPVNYWTSTISPKMSGGQAKVSTK